MSLYRKAGELTNTDDLNYFTEELFDRFGPPPMEVNNLLITLMIKNKCLKSKIKIIDAGPKGILIGFKNNYFKETGKLFEWINEKSGIIKIRPDQKLYVQKNLKTRDEKINSVLETINQLELLSS